MAEFVDGAQQTKASRDVTVCFWEDFSFEGNVGVTHLKTMDRKKPDKGQRAKGESQEEHTKGITESIESQNKVRWSYLLPSLQIVPNVGRKSPVVEDLFNLKKN